MSAFRVVTLRDGEVSPPTSGPTRRQLAAGGVAVTLLGLTSCTDDRRDEPSALPRLTRHPDHDLVVASLAAEQAHLDRVDAVRRKHRAVRAALAASASVHLSHVELLRGAVEGAGGDTGEDTGGSDATSTAPWPVPGTPARALSALSRSARDLYGEQVDVAMAAESGTFARLAAGMAASAAQQQRLLADLRPVRGGADR